MSEERTFTQAELDQILSDRLKKERTKYQQEAQARAAELDKRERLLTAKADWSKRGLPADLIDTLDLSNEKAIDTAAGILSQYTTTNDQPKNMRGGFVGGDQNVMDSDSEAPIREAFGLNKKG